MSFLGNPCKCGGALDEVDADTKFCIDCGRKLVRTSYGWNQVTHRDNIKVFNRCKHKRIEGQECSWCPNQVASSYHA